MTDFPPPRSRPPNGSGRKGDRKGERKGDRHGPVARAKRLRLRRRGRRAYIRSVYFLPSLCTLGNAVCGFAAIYVAFLSVEPTAGTTDPLTLWWASRGLAAAAYLIFLAMFFDAMDGRLARFARHTTDFGGQLDSLADVISFGAAPAFLMLVLFRQFGPQDLPLMIHRAVWAIGALYLSCAALRLARFNASNSHGEQHHFSFLGLPSPGAAGAVASVILMQRELAGQAAELSAAGDSPHWAYLLSTLADGCVILLPVIVLCVGLLMISGIRYPHLVNRWLRGKRSMGRLLAALVLVLLMVVAHQYTMGVCAVAYAFWGLVSHAYFRLRRKSPVMSR